MAKFTNNNAKNVSIGYTPFEWNYGYYFWMSHKNNVDLYSKLKSADELAAELRELIIVCRKNFYHAQEF